jgi:D-aminoacyl-tRNA deacylase
MRAVVQRVASASVRVDGTEVSAIGPGLLALVGVGATDGPADAEYIAGKIRDLRIFTDERGRMNRSVGEAGGAVLVVSQFTLYGDCRRGRRPSFDAAGPPGPARALYEAVADALRSAGLQVRTGAFQAHMEVELVNDGPVTLLLDSGRGF